MSKTESSEIACQGGLESAAAEQGESLTDSERVWLRGMRSVMRSYDPVAPLVDDMLTTRRFPILEDPTPYCDILIHSSPSHWRARLICAWMFGRIAVPAEYRPAI